MVVDVSVPPESSASKNSWQHRGPYIESKSEGAQRRIALL
jgi:hypothetical protein